MKVKLTITIVVIVALAMSLSSCFLIPQKLLSPKLLSPANGATDVSTKVSFQWSDPNPDSNLNSYKVYFGTSTTPSYFQKTDKTQVAISGLDYSTTYYWQVAVVNKSEKVATSTIWHFTTMALPKPSTPVLSVTSVSTDSVSLEWSKSTNAASITLYSATSSQFSQVVTLPSTATSYTVTELKPSTTYKFFVVASNTSGVATSNTVTATTQSIPTPPKPVLPSTPVLSVTSVSTSSVSLEWTKSTNASAIDIYSATSAQFSQIVSLSPDATSYTANGLNPSTTYKFFIVATNPSGKATSNTVIATTQSIPSSTTSFSIYLTDKPLPLSSVSAVYVNLSDISVHAALNGTSTWYSMLSTPTTYNLVDLVGTVVSVATKSLPSSALITQIRLEVASATVVVGTQTFVAKVPSGKIHLSVAPVTVSQSVDLFLDFDLSRSLKKLGNGNYQLSPVIHPVSGNMRGMVKGKVLLDSKPLANASVSLSTSATIVSETYTKMNGQFTFAAVVTGSYTLSVEASGASTFSTSITVNKGVNDVGTINLTSTSDVYPPETPVITSIKANKNVVTLTWAESSTNVSNFGIWRKSDPAQAYTLIASVNSSTVTYADTVQLGKKYCYMISANNPYGIAWSKPTSVITPPVLTVTPSFKKVDKRQPFSFTVVATSVAGIEKIVGNLDTQIASVNTWTGSLTFDSPSTSGDYTATFTAYDNSPDHNQTIVTATVDVSTSLPTVSFVTIPATVGSGISFQVSVEATAIGTGNTINSITIGGTTATFTLSSSNTYIATVTIKRIGNGLTTLIATATDGYGNDGSVIKDIYVDGKNPELTIKLIGTGVSAATQTFDFDSNNTTMSATLYTNSIATSTWYRFDNSDATLTVHDEYVVNVSGSSIPTSTTYPVLFPYHTYISTATISESVKGTETINDMFGNSATYTYTIETIVDSVSPTMSIDASAIVAAGKPFIATITVNDTGGSGLATSTSFIATYDGSTVPSASYTYNAGKFVLNLQTPGTTQNSTISAYIEDKAGNATSLTKQLYVDGTAPTITAKLSGSNIYLVNPTGTWTYNSSTSSTTTVQLYYGKSSTPTIVGTVTDNSGTNINVSVKYDSNPATTSTTTPSTTFSISLKNGTYDLTIKATDIVLNANDSTITFVATRDMTPPTVTIAASADTSTTALSTTSTLATVTYTAYDNTGGSGLVGTPLLTIASTYNNQTPASSALTLSTVSATINVMNLLLSPNLSLEGKAGVATATISATDNVGNAATKSDSIYFDFRFLVATATRENSITGSPVVITFNTVATTSSFASADLYLVSSAATYYVYTAELPAGTSKLATITVFASGSTTGATVAASDIATGTYNLYILKGIVGAATTTNDATISNSGLSITIP